MRAFMGRTVWKIHWASTGWTSRSLSLPQSVDGLLELRTKTRLMKEAPAHCARNYASEAKVQDEG